MITKLVRVGKTFFSCSSCDDKLIPEPGTLHRGETELNRCNPPMAVTSPVNAKHVTTCAPQMSLESRGKVTVTSRGHREQCCTPPSFPPELINRDAMRFSWCPPSEMKQWGSRHPSRLASGEADSAQKGGNTKLSDVKLLQLSYMNSRQFLWTRSQVLPFLPGKMPGHTCKSHRMRASYILQEKAQAKEPPANLPCDQPKNKRRTNHHQGSSL